MVEESGPRGTEKEHALSQLRARYGEARLLIPLEEPSSDLEWILGPKINPDRRLLHLDEKMVRIVGSWLRYLAGRVERVADPARHSAANNLRLAAEGFAHAFRRP